MNDAARKALAIIQDCVLIGRYRLLLHFRQRLAQRGLFWSDAQAVLDVPTHVCSGGHDEQDREKWIVSGRATDVLKLEIVCVLDVDEFGDTAIFVTIYEKGR